MRTSPWPGLIRRSVHLATKLVDRKHDSSSSTALERSRLTTEGMMAGTVSYVPPEQAMGGDLGINDFGYVTSNARHADPVGCYSSRRFGDRANSIEGAHVPCQAGSDY